jgi:thioredoxin-like negative regulator of GroEL
VERVPGATWRADQLPPGRVAVMFTADWCGHCHRFLHHFKRVPGAILVDISEEDEPAWEDHDIEVVPTVIVFEDGKPVRAWAGVLGEHHVTQIVALLSA